MEISLLFLNFSSHSFVFFSCLCLWGEDYFIEDPRGRFCQHYTEASNYCLLLSIVKEKEL